MSCPHCSLTTLMHGTSPEGSCSRGYGASGHLARGAAQASLESGVPGAVDTAQMCSALGYATPGFVCRTGGEARLHNHLPAADCMMTCVQSMSACGGRSIVLSQRAKSPSCGGGPQAIGRSRK